MVTIARLAWELDVEPADIDALLSQLILIDGHAAVGREGPDGYRINVGAADTIRDQIMGDREAIIVADIWPVLVRDA